MPTLATNPSIELTKAKEIDLNEKNKTDINHSLNSTEPPILIVKKLKPSSKSYYQEQKDQQQQTQELSIVLASAFQVLNQDNLGQINKPNAIVHPVRRSQISTESNISNNVNHFETKTTTNDQNSNTKKIGSGLFSFARELDFRLRRLKKDNLTTSKNSSTQDTLANRPLFMTTVPKGVFLQPVKEPPVPSKRVYAYSSHPRIFTNNNPDDTNNKALLNHNNTRLGKEISNAINGIRSFTQFLSSTTHCSKKHREILQQQQQQHQQQQSYKNLMYDKRIIRGSNYSQAQPWNPYFAYAGLLSGKGDTDYSAKESERRRHLIKKRQVQTRNLRNVIGTPPPIYGRKHEDVQTEKYLEELYERPPVHEASAQTDLYLEKPPTPPYKPAKIGVDAETEILEGELFDFDTEVQPIIDTLVGHTVEQSLLEVVHEEEMSDLKKQQQVFLAQREAELAELRRLEAEELRLQAEKERRLEQDEIARQLDAEVQERVTAAKLLQGYIADILPGVLSHIEPLAQATDRTNLEKELCPWLTKEVAEEVGHIIDSKEILIEIIKEILMERASKYMDIPQEIEEDDDDDDEKQDIKSEEEISITENNEPDEISNRTNEINNENVIEEVSNEVSEKENEKTDEDKKKQ